MARVGLAVVLKGEGWAMGRSVAGPSPVSEGSGGESEVCCGGSEVCWAPAVASSSVCWVRVFEVRECGDKSFISTAAGDGEGSVGCGGFVVGVDDVAAVSVPCTAAIVGLLAKWRLFQWALYCNPNADSATLPRNASFSTSVPRFRRDCANVFEDGANGITTEQIKSWLMIQKPRNGRALEMECFKRVKVDERTTDANAAMPPSLVSVSAG